MFQTEVDSMALVLAPQMLIQLQNVKTMHLNQLFMQSSSSLRERKYFADLPLIPRAINSNLQPHIATHSAEANSLFPHSLSELLGFVQPLTLPLGSFVQTSPSHNLVNLPPQWHPPCSTVITTWFQYYCPTQVFSAFANTFTLFTTSAGLETSRDLWICSSIPPLHIQSILFFISPSQTS